MVIIGIGVWLTACTLPTPTPSPESSTAGEGGFTPLPAAACMATESNPEGPYYLPNAPIKREMMPSGAAGTPLIISGTVYAADCQTPLVGAVVDIWHADASGEYDFSEEFRYRGKVETDANGFYQFVTVKPGNYGTRPSHIHFKISHSDATALTTQLYFEGDPLNQTDGLVIESLIIPLNSDASGGLTGTFNIILKENQRPM